MRIIRIEFYIIIIGFFECTGCLINFTLSFLMYFKRLLSCWGPSQTMSVLENLTALALFSVIWNPSLASFLITEDSSWLTGQIIAVDGGWSKLS